MSLQRDQALLFTFTGYLLMLGVGPGKAQRRHMTHKGWAICHKYM